MRKWISTFLCLALLFLINNQSAFAGFYKGKNYYTAPTTQAKNINFSSIDGNLGTINWTIGNGTRRLVIVSQDSAVSAVPVDGVNYTSNATFGLGSQLKPGQFVVANHNGNYVNMEGLLPGHTYHVAIFEFNGVDFGTEYLAINPARGSFATLSAPTQGATNLVATNINGHSISLSVTKGNGTRRIIVARKGSPVNANPTDLKNYSGNASFGSGSQIGSGNFVIYADVNNTVTAAKLEPSTTYYFAVFEQNGFWGPVYHTSNPATASFTTTARPTIPASNITSSQVEGASMQIGYTTGNGLKRIVVLRLGQPVDAEPVDGNVYSGDKVFGKGDSLAPGQYIVSNTESNSISVEGLKHSTTYYFKIFEFDGLTTAPKYLVSSVATANFNTLFPPTTGAQNITVTNILSNQAKINWVAGNGSRRIVIMKEGSPVDALPSHYMLYGGSSSFGSGTQIGNKNYVVLNSNTTNETVTNLLPNKTYHIAVIEFNGFGSPVYNVTSIPVASFTTIIKPTVPSTSMSFSSVEGNTMSVTWTKGNGQKRIVIARAGSAVDAKPVDGQVYTANSKFGLGSQVEPGQYVLSNSNEYSVSVTGLVAGTVYHYAVFEYSESNGTYYQVDQYLASSKSTLAAPTVPATNMTFNVTSNYIQVNCTAGNGSRRIIIANKTGPVNVNLTDYTFYAGNDLGNGNHVINNTAGTNASINNLAPNTTYWFAIIEQNGFNGPVFLNSMQLKGSVTTLSAPTVATSNIGFSGVEGNGMNVTWTMGNGSKRLVIARKDLPVTATPTNGMEYYARDSFARGTEISPGQFVVYAGSSWMTTVKGLDTSAIYHFAVFEFDGTGASTGYLTSTFGTGSKRTIGAPTIQATNIQFSNITTTTATIGYTKGNGANRIVVIKKGSPVDAVPQIFKSYNHHTGLGATPITAGNYAVYKGNAATTSVFNLEPGATYYFAVFEYNGDDGPVYLTNNPARGSFRTAGPPEVSADSIRFVNKGLTFTDVYWKNGDGQRRIIVAKESTPVDFKPLNNATYTANSFFGAGQLVGNNNFIVYNGFSDHFTITNLATDKVYYFTIYEYNQFGNGWHYRIVDSATALYMPKSFVADTSTFDGLNASITVGASAAGSTYNWFVDEGAGFNSVADGGVYSNSSTKTLNITGASTNMHNYKYKCTVGFADSTVTTNSATLTVNAFVWTGATNSDWFTASNWNANEIPVAASNVIINGGALNMPVIDAGNAICNNITINGTGKLTLNGGTLTVGKIIDNTGNEKMENNKVMYRSK